MKNSLIVIAALVLQVLPLCAEDSRETRQGSVSAAATVDQVADAGKASEPAVAQSFHGGADPGGADAALASVAQIGGERSVPPEQRGGSTELAQDADGGASGPQGGTASTGPDPCQPGIGCAVINGVWQMPRNGASNVSAVQQAGSLNLAFISQR
jgi:hypothetical protein